MVFKLLYKGSLFSCIVQDFYDKCNHNFSCIAKSMMNLISLLCDIDFAVISPRIIKISLKDNIFSLHNRIQKMYVFQS